MKCNSQFAASVTRPRVGQAGGGRKLLTHTRAKGIPIWSCLQLLKDQEATAAPSGSGLREMKPAGVSELFSKPGNLLKDTQLLAGMSWVEIQRNGWLGNSGKERKRGNAEKIGVVQLEKGSL